MRVRDVMTPRAESVAPDETLRAAAAMMRDLGVGALVVCEGERAIGLLTDRDIVVRSDARGLRPGDVPVREAMTPQVVACHEDEELEAAVARMARGAVRRLVVLDAASQPVGMLSVDDVALRSAPLAGEVIEHVLAPERPIERGPWPWWEEPAR
jgi:CBS domain-containing protein